MNYETRIFGPDRVKVQGTAWSACCERLDRAVRLARNCGRIRGKWKFDEDENERQESSLIHNRRWSTRWPGSCRPDEPTHDGL